MSKKPKGTIIEGTITKAVIIDAEGNEISLLSHGGEFTFRTDSQLRDSLKEAEQSEDYEKCARIRDETIKRRSRNEMV